MIKRKFIQYQKIGAPVPSEIGTLLQEHKLDLDFSKLSPQLKKLMGDIGRAITENPWAKEIILANGAEMFKNMLNTQNNTCSMEAKATALLPDNHFLPKASA